MKLKKILLILFTITIIITVSITSYSCAEPEYYNIMDATYIQKIIAELVTADENDLYVLDLNKDGVLDITDATYIKYMIAELVPACTKPTATQEDTQATDSPTLPVETQPSSASLPTYLYFDEDEIILVKGETYELNVATDIDKNCLEYISEQPSIVKVDNNGLITAVSQGKTTISVIAENGMSDICTVQIINSPSIVNLNATSKSCKVGNSFTLTAKTDNEFYPYEYVWKSSNPKVATVTRDSDNSAAISTMSQGSADITVETFNGKKAVCTVTVSGSDIRCIDLSSWQGSNVDFEKIKADGIDYVILRAGYGRENYQKDNQFDNYYAKARKAGLKIGVYWFSYAMSAEEGFAEADACLYCLENKELDLPVYFDMEYESAITSLSKSAYTQMAVNFCSTIENAGYKAGIYSSAYVYGYHLDYNTLVGNGYSIWNAQWSNTCSVVCDLWQYTCNAIVNGVSTEVDCSYVYNLNIVKKYDE